MISLNVHRNPSSRIPRGFLGSLVRIWYFEGCLAVISPCTIETLPLSPESLGGLLYIIVIDVYSMIISMHRLTDCLFS